MSQLVLARAHRPQSFHDLVGQPLVVEALENSFKMGRTHHAYLFTGTRGVGKTTLARIIAQCFNCEQGITHDPCGTCQSCMALRQQHMVDFIEIDAASRTKVEDTREILDNIPYPPAMARHKIYLIDEVHMLSNHSFNALLKTLEEPPKHVIFILATTDPQKLPSTILSRCLQLHLTPIPSALIADHLAHILKQENIAFEKKALPMLAEAAEGSLRDALSLLEQSIALCSGEITHEKIIKQLGLIPTEKRDDLASAILEQDAPLAYQILQEILSTSIDHEQLLIQLQTLWHHLSVALTLDTKAPMALSALEHWQQKSKKARIEQAQLLYQIATLSRKDFAFSPSTRLGLEMAILRMASFKPNTTNTPPTSPISAKKAIPPKTKSDEHQAKVHPTPSEPASPQSKTMDGAQSFTHIDQDNWGAILDTLKLGGMVRAIFKHCSFVAHDGETLTLYIPPNQAKIIHDRAKQQVIDALRDKELAQDIKIVHHSEDPVGITPMDQDKKRHAKEKAERASKLKNHPTVQELKEAFSGQIVETVMDEETMPS